VKYVTCVQQMRNAHALVNKHEAESFEVPKSKWEFNNQMKGIGWEGLDSSLLLLISIILCSMYSDFHSFSYL
jgi:hypothetical protein